MEGSSFAKWFICIGVSFVVIGILIWLTQKIGIPFGKLPGDLHVHKEKVSFNFPITTSLLISLVLTLVLNLIFWLWKK